MAPGIAPLLRSRRHDCRRLACESLSSMGNAAANQVESMVPLLNDDQPEVCAAARHAIRRLKADNVPMSLDVIDNLAALIKNASRVESQVRACELLGRMGAAA